MKETGWENMRGRSEQGLHSCDASPTPLLSLQLLPASRPRQACIPAVLAKIGPKRRWGHFSVNPELKLKTQKLQVVLVDGMKVEEEMVAMHGEMASHSHDNKVS
jgi:hypothetical protein